jgi:hypothetical protein
MCPPVSLSEWKPRGQEVIICVWDSLSSSSSLEATETSTINPENAQGHSSPELYPVYTPMSASNVQLSSEIEDLGEFPQKIRKT